MIKDKMKPPPREVKEDTRQIISFLRRIGVFNVRGIEKKLGFTQGTIRMDMSQNIARTKLDKLESYLSETGFKWDDRKNSGHAPTKELADSEKARESTMDSFSIEGGVYLEKNEIGFWAPIRFVSIHGEGRYVDDRRAEISVPDGYEDHLVKVIPVDSRTVAVRKDNNSVENVKIIPVIKRSGVLVVKTTGKYLLLFHMADDIEE